MPCRNPCRLYIHLAFTYSVGPSSVVWSELGPAPPFPPMRVLEVLWSWALYLMCEVALLLTLFLCVGFTMEQISWFHWHFRQIPFVWGCINLLNNDNGAWLSNMWHLSNQHVDPFNHLFAYLHTCSPICYGIMRFACTCQAKGLSWKLENYYNTNLLNTNYVHIKVPHHISSIFVPIPTKAWWTSNLHGNPP